MDKILEAQDEGLLFKRYNADRPRMAFQLCILGLTLDQIADVMGVTTNTIASWKKKFPEFAEQLDRGRTRANAEVAHALYKRATGYTYEQEVVNFYQGVATKTTITKVVPPDPWSAVKFLAMRQPELWSQTHRIEHTNTNININKFDFSGISTEELELLRKIGTKTSESQRKELGD